MRDERGIAGTPGADGPHEETFLHSGGVVDFVDHLAPDTAVTDTWHLTGSGAFTETVPVLDERGHMTAQEVSRTCDVDIALRWGTGYETEVRSFVNIISTPKGGTHLAGFEAGLLRTMRKAVDANARRLKISARDTSERIDKEDVLAGMTAVVTVRLAEPQFEGQTKEVLGTGPVRAIVAKVLDTELGAIFVSPKRDHKAQSSPAAGQGRRRDARPRCRARKQKEISRRKNALETSSLPAKLADCRSDDVERSELFIVEGDSALGTAKLARSSDFQALLPIRGKILNVQKASVTDMLKNAECAAIIQVVGAGSGRIVRPGGGALREDRPDDRRRRRRRAHPHPAAHAAVPVHATARGGGARVRRRAAAAPHRGDRRAAGARTSTSTRTPRPSSWRR